MADTIREKIIAAIENTLENYGSWTVIPTPNIFRGREYYDSNVEPPPVISILPQVEAAERTSYGKTQCEMPVSIACVLPLGRNDNPSEVGEAALGELIAAMFSSTPTDAEDFYYSGGGIGDYPEDSLQKMLNIGISVTVVYETDIGDPYHFTTT